jgi:hypothetical protein
VYRLSSFAWLFQIIKKETPIIIYKVVHTGPNSQLGGLKDGLLSVANHELTELAVKKPEIPPTANGTEMEIINLKIGFMI